MQSEYLLCLLVVSALVFFAGCTAPQPATVPTPVATSLTVATPGISATASPSPAITATSFAMIVDKPWRVLSWTTVPELDMNNTSVKTYMADYIARGNDTFTWYKNGTVVYRHPNGTAFVTGTWSLAPNGTALSEKYTATDGFYTETENEIVNVSATVFVIRYPAEIGGKRYVFTETQGI